MATSIERLLTEEGLAKILNIETTRRQLGRPFGIAAAGVVFPSLGRNPNPELPEELPTLEGRIRQDKFEFWFRVAPIFFKSRGKISQLRENGKLGDFGLLRMYHPIYREAQERFGIPWYLSWMKHDAESDCSKNPAAFIRESGHYGAGQRALGIYPDSQVEAVAQGYEYLATLPQNHFDDWKELLWVASKLSRDAQDAIRTNPWKDCPWALKDAIISYLGGDGKEAQERIKRFEKLIAIFGSGHDLNFHPAVVG